jgi:autotransporter-associated beta strand protein
MRPKALSGSIAKYSRGLALSVLTLIGASQAPGATVTWDANGTGAGQTDGAGVWLTANQWWTGSANTTWVSGSDAIFGSGGVGGAVTLASPTTVNSLTFNTFSGTYTLGTALQAITLNGGITINSTASAVTIVSDITLGGSQNLTNNSSSNLTITGSVAGTGSPTLTNNGSGTNFVSLAGALESTVGKIVQNSATSTLSLRGASTLFAGNVEILKGTLRIGSHANNLGTAAGQVTLGASSGSDAATLELIDNSSPTYAAKPIVLGTTAGTLTIRITDSTGTNTHTLTGAISGNNHLTLENAVGDDKLTFDTGGINNTGTLTHIGAGTGDLTINSVIGLGVTGVIQNSATSRMVLSGANTYTGGTTINRGTLTLNRQTGSLTATSLTFGGSGTFNMDNVGASGALTQSLGALNLNAGNGTVQVTRTAAQDQLITFASLAARATGATGNFVTGGTPSATNGIKLTSTANAPLSTGGSAPNDRNNPGFFFGGTEYARYDTGGYFRAPTYGTDTNALATIGASGSGLAGIDATKDVKITGTITGQTVASVNTINLGANNFTISSGILSVNGLLSTGTLAFGGGTIQPTSSGGEIVVNTNAGTLTLSSTIQNNTTASSLTKTGAGTLILQTGNNTGLTGTTYVNQGTLQFNSTASMPLGTTIVQSGATLTLNATLSRNVTLNGGTLLGKDTDNAFISSATITLTADSTFSGGSKNLVFDNTAVIDTGAGYTATFISNGLRNSITGLLVSTSPLIRGSGGIILANAGTGFTLNNINTYTGPTRITNIPANASAGFNTIGNVGGGASSFGAPTTVANGTITLGSGTNVNAISYNGTGNSTTDRVIDLAGTTGGITIDQSGTGNLKFTSNFTVSGAGSKTLTLQGAGTGEIAGVIPNNSGTNTTAISKTGGGIWILSGNNTYTGTTGVGTASLAGGTLFLTGNNLTSGVTTNGTISTAAVIARSATALGTGNVTVGTQTNLTYNAATDTSLSIAGTLGITGGTTTTIGASIGSTFSGARINVAGNATTTAAAVKVNIYGNSLSGTTSGNGTYTLVQGNGGSNTLSSATYTLGTVYNATNFTVGTTIGSTTGTVTAAITAATPLSGTVYWRGTGTAGISRVWAASNGNAGSPDSNWTATNGGSTPTVLVPGSGVDVVVSSSAVNLSGTPVGTTLGSDMSINSLTISDPSFGLGLNADGYKLTIGNAAGITQTATSAGSVIAADVALGASQSWTNNSASSLTVSGSVSGAFGITKQGNGTLVLSGNSTYAGTTTVSAGVLNIQSDAALGSTAGVTSVTSGAALQIQARAPLAIQQGTLSVGAEALTINGTGYNNDNTGALRNIAGTNFYGGTVTLGSASRINSDANTLTLTAANSITGTQNLTLGGAGSGVVSGTITTGSGTLTKDGLGAWTLSGANTYTGATTINGGTLQVGNGTAGSLNSTTGTALTFGNSGSFIVSEASGVSQGMGALTFSVGSGNVTSVNNGGNSFLTFASLTARATGTTGNFIASGGTNGTTNKIALTTTTNAPMSTSGSASNNPGFFFGGSEYARYDATNGYFRATDYTTSDDGVAALVSGSNMGNVTGLDVKLNGVITAQGTAQPNTINLGANNFTITAGQTLSVNGLLSSGGSAATFSTGTIQPTALGGEIVIRVNGSTDKLTLNSTIQNNSNPSTLTKTGAGTLVLSSGTNTGLTGTTYVNQGTLQLNNPGSMPAGTTIVQSGATLVLVSGTYTRNVNLNGGTLAGDGANDPTFAATVTLTANSTISGGGKNIFWNNSSVIDTGAGYTANFIAGAFRTAFSGPLIIGNGGVILATTNGQEGPKLLRPNTYTGPTRITDTPTTKATTFNTIGNVGGGASSFGAPTTVANGTITLGSGANQNTISYQGTGSTTDRVIDLAGTTGGITIEQSGTGNLKFTSNFTASGAGSKTLTLQGGGTGEIAGVIPNNSGTNTTAISKTGTGIWILSGNNTYTGTTGVGTASLAGGTLFLTGNNLTSGVTTNGTISTAAVIARSATALGTGNVTVGTATNLTYNAATDTPLSIAGTLGITGGTTTTIGASIGLTTTSARINVTGAATISNAVHTVNIYGNSFGGGAGTYNLITGGAGSSLNPATVPTLGKVFNNTNFTVNTTGGDGGTSAFVRTPTTLGVVISSATPLTAGDVFWKGGLAGATGVWSASNGTTQSNWQVTDTVDQPLAPNSTNDLVFSTATSPGTMVGMTLGSDMSVRTLTINNTATAFGLLADGYTLTITPASSAAGITMNTSVLASTFAANVALGGDQTWTNNSANSLTVSGSVSGDFAITKLGTGTLVLSGNNTYTGTTTVSAGILSLGNSAALQNSALNTTNSIAGDTNNGLRTTVTTLTLGGLTGNKNFAASGGVFTSTTGGYSGVTALTLNPGTGATPSYSGIIADGATGMTVTKSGLGTQTLSVANSYTGVTTISNGILEVTANNALGSNAAGTTVANGATLKLTNVTYSTAEGLTINGTGLSSGGALESSGTTTFAGQITAATSATINAISGTLELSGGLVKNGTTLTFTGAGAFTISSVISGALANSDLAVDATTVTLTAANTYNGPTTITNGGTLIANALGALPLSPRSAVSFTGTGTSALNLGANQFVASLTSVGAATVALGSNTLTVGITGGPDTTFAGSITGAGNLTKDTNSKQVLSGANGYTGTTTVSAGTLEVTGTLSGTTGVTVNTSGTLLLNNAATPAINSAAPVTLDGGAIKMSSSVTGQAQSFGALTLSASSTLDFGTHASAGNTFNFSTWITHTSGSSALTIDNWTGTENTLGATGTDDRLIFTGLASTFLGQFGPNDIIFTGHGPGYDAIQFGGQFEIVPVPEPATTALIGSIALCALVGYRERRRFTGLGKRTAARK